LSCVIISYISKFQAFFHSSTDRPRKNNDPTNLAGSYLFRYAHTGFLVSPIIRYRTPPPMYGKGGRVL
jgi:hypothetical protein